MKWVIVSIHIQESPQAVSLAAGMLKANALAQGFPGEIDLIDATIDATARELADQILAASPMGVGFSVYLWNQPMVLETAKILREEHPSILLIAGGPETAARPQALFEVMDALVFGEGETAFARILKETTESKIPAGIPGTALSRESFEAGECPLLETLPSPYLEGILQPKPDGGLLWELSRGCPYRCSYCFESRGVPGVRRFDRNRIAAELRLFEEAGTAQIWVLDPTFNHQEETALDILALIEEIAPEIHYIFEVRIEKITEQLADAFSRINCSLQIGLQSRHNEVLKRVNRSIRPDLFRSKIELLESRGVTYGLDLIYGLPGDHLKGFVGSLDYALSLRPNTLDVFRLAVLPGTELFEKRKEEGLVADPNPPYLLQSSDGFSPGDLDAADRMAEAVQEIYNQGAGVGWFGLAVEVLGLSPGKLLEKFWKQRGVKSPGKGPSGWLESALGRTAETSGRSPYRPLLLAVLQYHCCWSRVFRSQPNRLSEPSEEQSCRLGKSASFYRTVYSPPMLEALDEMSPKDFVKTVSEDPSGILLVKNGGEVTELIFDEETSEFIENLERGMLYGHAVEENDSLMEFLLACGALEIVASETQAE